MPSNFKSSRALATLMGGVLFGFGLALSTMTRPEVILSFLTFHDLGLMLVMGGAVVVAMVGFRLGRTCEHPVCGGDMDTYCSHWTRNTLIGSALFGVGWGLGGVCPGPAIAGLGAGNVSMLWSLGGILLGALLQGLVAGRRM